jgi:hypothetical protein
MPTKFISGTAYKFSVTTSELPLSNDSCELTTKVASTPAAQVQVLYGTTTVIAPVSSVTTDQNTFQYSAVLHIKPELLNSNESMSNWNTTPLTGSNLPYAPMISGTL